MKRFKLFGKTYEIRAADVKTLPSVSDDSAWQMYLAGQGYAISAEGALQVAAVFRCVDLISKTMAALPLHMYKNTGEGKQKARDHPLYKLLYVLPNRTTTAYELMQMLVANMLLTRGGYLRIVRDRYGFVRHLKNLPTSCCSEVYTNRENGEQYIYVTYDGITETLREGDFVFIPGFRFGDRTPEDPMTIAASVLGLNNSMTQYAQRGFSGTSPGGYITYPGQLSDAAYERFKKDFQSNYGGVENAGKWMFLENGSTAQENAFMSGTGTNQPLGIFTASDSGIATGRDVTAASATAVATDDLIECKYGVKGQYMRGASWVMHRDLCKMIAKLKDSDGQYIWQPSVQAGQPDMLLGAPVYMSEYAPNAVAAGKYVAVYGDFKTGYWVCDSDGLYIQVLNELYAVNNEIGYVVEYYGDGAPVVGEAFSRLKMKAS